MLPTNSWKITAIVGIVALVVGYGTARMTVPTKVVTKTQEVIRTVTVENKDQVTTETTIKKPDGTVITQERTEDKDLITTHEDESIKVDKTVTNEKPSWMISGGYGYDFGGGTPTPTYMFQAQKRIIGNIFAGGMVNTNLGNRTSGLLTVGFEF